MEHNPDDSKDGHHKVHLVPEITKVSHKVELLYQPEGDQVAPGSVRHHLHHHLNDKDAGEG